MFIVSSVHRAPARHIVCVPQNAVVRERIMQMPPFVMQEYKVGRRRRGSADRGAPTLGAVRRCAARRGRPIKIFLTWCLNVSKNVW